MRLIFMLDGETVVVPIGVALLAAAGAFFAAIRRMSGKIATSEAAQLWAESASIREDYRVKAERNGERIARLEERLALCEKDNNKLSKDNLVLMVKIAECERTIAVLREENTALREQIAHLQANQKEANGG